ncbi:MAG: hypothetical protein ACP5GO_05565 [Thermoprotei archaeon]|jgi:hypothetical protein
MKPLLLGIDGLSYGKFMDCGATFLLELVDTASRGVTESELPQKPCTSWRSVLGLGQSDDVYSSSITRSTGAVLVNVPLSNPTLGLCSRDLTSSPDIEAEVKCVESAIKDNIAQRPVIAGITSIQRVSAQELCRAYAVVDGFVSRLLGFVEDFIIFSSYGVLGADDLEPYGVYLATIARPRSRDTIRPEEVGTLFERLVYEASERRGCQMASFITLG